MIVVRIALITSVAATSVRGLTNPDDFPMVSMFYKNAACVPFPFFSRTKTIGRNRIQ